MIKLMEFYLCLARHRGAITLFVNSYCTKQNTKYSLLEQMKVFIGLEILGMLCLFDIGLNKYNVSLSSLYDTEK